ncbi:VOC family protein [Paenibacillus arenosi]|uniref:VOC family protein n=1 Tax=Paenibacillus arenosi TaxID=2774142 RepID=A0ABR9AT73_9BACL|nr:VOC family protein [Paenibacillus arenosi]MBD8496894.1 VOC family protein [Paenibacillus arenosi]
MKSFNWGGVSVGLLHHIEIYVSDLKRSAEFWGWFLSELGYTPYQQWEEGRSWKLGDTYLVFVQAKEKHLDVPYNRCRVGLNHLAFHANSREQVDELTEKVRSKGMDVLYKEKHPFAGGEDYYALFFEDPDRIKVELVAP